MTPRAKTREVTVEEIPRSSTDDAQFQVVAYSTEQGTVVVIREWPVIDAAA